MPSLRLKHKQDKLPGICMCWSQSLGGALISCHMPVYTRFELFTAEYMTEGWGQMGIPSAPSMVVRP